MSEGDFIVKYTNKDIMDELSSIKSQQARIEKKLDEGLGTLKEKSIVNRNLIYGAYGFGMFILGVLIAHAGWG